MSPSDKALEKLTDKQLERKHDRVMDKRMHTVWDRNCVQQFLRLARSRDMKLPKGVVEELKRQYKGLIQEVNSLVDLELRTQEMVRERAQRKMCSCSACGDTHYRRPPEKAKKKRAKAA